MLLLAAASPLRAQIATGSAGGASAGSGGEATGGATAPAVGGTGQANSAPSVGSISSPSSSGTTATAPGAPSSNGNSNGSGGAANGNGNGASGNGTSGGNGGGPNSAGTGQGGGGGANQTASGGIPPGIGPVTLTLPQIVNIVLGNNTAVIEARQRLQLAIEQINQLNAQAKPQLRADAADTYNSYDATSTTLGPTVENPVLPSGGTIPTITDQAAASISTLNSPTSVGGTVAPGVSNSAGFGPAGPGVGVTGSSTGAGGAGAGGGVGAGSSTPSSTPGTSTSSGGNSSSTTSAPTSSGTTGTGATNTGTGAGAAGTSTNGAPASSGASGGQSSGASNGTAGQGASGTGNTGTSGTNTSGTSGATSGTSAGGANTSGTAGSASGTSGGASGTSGAAGASGNGAGTNGTTGSGTSGASGNTGANGTAASPDAGGNGTNGVGGANGTGTGTGDTGGASSSSLVQPQEQLAPIPSILQAFITADGGGSDEADEIATASQTRPAAVTAPTRDVSASVSQRPSAEPAAAGASPAATTPTSAAAEETVADAARNTYAARATGSQYIDLFGYFPAARDVQNSIRDFYLLDLERIENETALVAKNTFFNVLYAQAQYAVDQEQVTYAAEDVRIVTAQRQQGLAADYDVLTAETALANAQQLLFTAQNQLQLADSQLSYLVGVSPDRAVTLVQPAVPPVNETFSVPQSVQIAGQRRPELRQAQKNVNIAQRLIKLAGATLSPTLGIVGVAQYNSTDTMFTPHTLATISAQLGVPIDDGGATRSRVRSARVDLQTQQLNLGSLQLSVALEVRQAILDVTNAQTRVSTAQVAVTQAEEARRLAVVRYENGLGTLLDITNAVAQLATAQSNLADANFSYDTALATLVRDEGGR